MEKKERKRESFFNSIFMPIRSKKKQLVIWVDGDRRVHSKAKGSLTAQMKAIEATVEYLQMYAFMCQDVSAQALNVDDGLIRDNEELKRKLKTANNTLEMVNKDMKRKARSNGMAG